MNLQPKSLSQLAFKKFKQNKVGLISLFFILFCGFIAVFCYHLAPDNSNFANQMHLEIHSKPPGFKVNMLTIPSDEKKENSFIDFIINGNKITGTEIPILSYSIQGENLEIIQYADGLAKQYPLSVINNKPKIFIKQRNFILGTDKYGRDLLSRLLIGTRISFSIGFIAVFISLFIGVFIGALAGYFGGKIDVFIMWIINITWSRKRGLAGIYCSWINYVGRSCKSSEGTSNYY